jgi:uncharacterized protein
VMSASPALAGSDRDFKAGRAAYDLYDNETAIRLWRPLAERGDARAQASLGFMYQNGFGVAQDFASAARWYGIAAEQGQADAQYSLGMLYLTGRGVQQSYMRAHMFCELAMLGGVAGGLECRESASRRMTADQLSDSYRAAAEWYERTRAK